MRKYIALGMASLVIFSGVAYAAHLKHSTTSPIVSKQHPTGQHGSWKLTFEDDFTGTHLDLQKWEPTWFGEGTEMNNVKTYSKNVSVKNGTLFLSLSSNDEGALIHTGYQKGHYQLPTDAYIEARILFPGNKKQVYNWPAWWVNSTRNYPISGEHDIAEGLGELSVNYHSPKGDFNQGSVPGVWTNSYHIYGLYRKKTSAEVYYDGKLVKKYTTADDGGPLDVVFNVGVHAGNDVVIGKKGALQVDYVRAWEK